MTTTTTSATSLAERLTRVWGIKGQVTTNLDNVFDDAYDVEYFQFYGTLKDEVTVCYSLSLGLSESIEIVGQNKEFMYGYLMCYNELFDLGHLRAYHLKKETEFAQFAAQWLPFFRRNCWLSGCDIEASAHEKVEWIQGFSQEEIETWQLKF